MITIEEIKEYIEYNIKDMNNYINTNPYCTRPIESINACESRCFGVIDFAIHNGLSYEPISTMWDNYLEYFRNRRNEVRENARQKKGYD